MSWKVAVSAAEASHKMIFEGPDCTFAGGIVTLLL